MTKRKESDSHMTQAELDAWCEALESGKFKQTNGTLCHRNPTAKKLSFCCLGVKAHIDGIPGTYFNEYTGDKVNEKTFLFTDEDGDIVRHDGFLPNGYAGLTEKTQTALAQMNDNGMTFAQIADWLRKNIKIKPERRSTNG